jgi:hypothetical protein
MMSWAMQAMARESGPMTTVWSVMAFLCLFYGSNAAGLAVMDEARGREVRVPLEALRGSLRCAHRLLLVVLLVLLATGLLLAAVAGLLWACRLPALGPWLMPVVITVGVPVLGLAALALLSLVSTVAAPAVWAGLSVRQVLAMLVGQARRRFAHATLLAAAVSLLGAAMVALIGFVVLAGGRLVLGLAVVGLGLDVAPGPVMAALLGQGLRVVGGPPVVWSPLTQAALTGAGIVFALGLVLPGVVYLRGLCEVFLALRRLDVAWGLPDPLPSGD